MDECHMDFASFNKFVCEMCFQHMISMHETYELWMISILKLWSVKFVMYVLTPLALKVDGL